MESTIPYLAGCLFMSLASKEAGHLKIRDVSPDPPDGVLVELQSGLKLRVTVEAVPVMRGPAP